MRKNVKDYYLYMFNRMEKAIKDDNKVEAEYCALYSLMAFDHICEDADKSYKIADDLNLTNDKYERILSLIESYKKRFFKFCKIRTLKICLVVLVVFLILTFILKLSSKLSAALSLIILLSAIYSNGKDSKERYKKWQSIFTEKHISKDLIEYNKKWLRGDFSENI